MKIMVWKILYKIYFKLLFDKTPEALRDKIRGRHRILNFLRLKASSSIESIDEDPTSIWDLEWDNLIILDACRYDKYQEIIGRSEYRVTKAGSTPYFVQNNFDEHDCSEVVCITGNPFYSDMKLEELVGQKDPFLKKYKTYMHGWDDDLGSVPPEPIVKDALKSQNEYPEKRKIIHFQQPHAPFIDTPELGLSKWNDVEFGKVNKEDAIQGYKDNLEYLVPYLEELVQQLDGKTVITADHGELLGEGGLYGHFTPTDAKGLRKVPWHEVEDSDNLGGGD